MYIPLLSSDMRQKVIIALSAFLLSGLFLSECELLNRNGFCSEYYAEELILNKTVDLKYSELYCNSEHEFRVSFDSISDSRCPIGVLCVWEGNASVRLILKHDGENTTTFRLNTNSSFLTDTLVNGLRFELIDILPYPEVDKDYQLDDYILRMHISD
jgi:hypothetical protein